MTNRLQITIAYCYAMARAKINARPMLQALIVALCASFILIARRPGAMFTPLVFAEDGTQFMLQDIQKGIYAFFVPCVGYLHFVSRALAFVAGFFDLTIRPYLYSWGSLAITVGVALRLYFTRLSVRFRLLFALVPCLVVGSSELYLNLSNMQWMVAVLIPVMLAENDAKTKGAVALDLFLTVCLGLTGPFMLLLFPLYWVSAFFFGWSRQKLLHAGIATVCFALQLFLVLHSERLAAKVEFEKDISVWLNAVLQNFWGTFFLGSWRELLPVSVIFGWVLVYGFSLMLMYRNATNQGKVLALILVLSGAFLAAVSYFSFRYNPKILDPFNIIRYFYLPFLWLIWLAFIKPEKALGALEKISNAVLFFPLLFGLSEFSHPIIPRTDWYKAVESLKEGKSLRVSINPRGWCMRINAGQDRAVFPPWHNGMLSCSEQKPDHKGCWHTPDATARDEDKASNIVEFLVR